MQILTENVIHILNGKHKNTKFLEENIGENPCDLNQAKISKKTN